MRKYFIISAFVVSFFSSSKAENADFVFSKIQIYGNTRTNVEVILRELPFAIGDTVSKYNIDGLVLKAQENLLNTSLFNFVDIEYSISNFNISISINVNERWYIWPYPILEHGARNWATFFRDADWSRVNYGAALELYNIGGQNRLLKLKIRAGYREHFAVSYLFNGIGDNRNLSIKMNCELFRQKTMVSSLNKNMAVYYNGRNNYVFSNFNSTFVVSSRIKLSSDVGLGLNYKTYFLPDTISYNTDNDNYDFFSSSYLNPLIYFSVDKRNNKVYPVNGLYFNLFAGYWHNLQNNLSSFAGLKSEFDVHFNIPDDRLSVHIKSSYRYIYEKNNSEPFFQNRLEFGKDFWIRGLEYYYFLGKNSFKLQNSIAFLISDFKIHKLPKFLPNEFEIAYSRIYADIFLDYIYTDGFSSDFNYQNQMNAKLLHTYGVGVSLETYYDRLFQIYVAYVPDIKKTAIFVNYQTPIVKLY